MLSNSDYKPRLHFVSNLMKTFTMIVLHLEAKFIWENFNKNCPRPLSCNENVLTLIGVTDFNSVCFEPFKHV